jgi:hypothetical protein
MQIHGGSVRFYNASPILAGSTEIFGNTWAQFDVQPGSPTTATFGGVVTLHDQANLKVTPTLGLFWNNDIAQRGSVAISDQLIVDGAATITAYDNRVMLSGVIAPGQDACELNLIGDNTFVFGNIAIRPTADRRLAFRFNGQKQTITLGSNQQLAGNGTIDSNFIINPLAIISPGESTGHLTIDGSLIWQSGGTYQWEINDATGSPGSTDGWDLLRVTGAMSVQNMTLRMFSLDQFGSPGSISGFNPLHSYAWVIASGEDLSGFDPSAVLVDARRFQQYNTTTPGSRFFVETRGNVVLLIYQAPESSSIMLAAQCFLGALAVLWRGRGRNRSQV